MKVVAQKVLKLHLDRGDDVWIISKRQSIVPEPREDVVTKRYERMLGVKLPHPVVQTQLRDKTPFLCERQIELYSTGRRGHRHHRLRDRRGNAHSHQARAERLLREGRGA